MNTPPFEKITLPGLDAYLNKFFRDYLGYTRIDNDPDASNAKATEAWRMVVPEDGARPFAVAYQPKLSDMPRSRVSRLYIERVIKHRDGSPSVEPVLYGFTDGLRHVFFSADPARNRDDRFDLSAETWRFEGVRDKAERLHRERLEFLSRRGRKRPKIEFLFDANYLSGDARFKQYVGAMRQELMRAVIRNGRALGGVVYHLLESPADRDADATRFVDTNLQLRQSLEELHLEIGMRLGDAVAAAVDTLLLRYVMVRFLEAYHPEAMDGLLKSGEVFERGKGQRHEVPHANVAASPTKKGRKANVTENLFDALVKPIGTFSDAEIEMAELIGKSLSIDVSRAKRKVKGADQMLFDMYSFDDARSGVATVLEEEDRRELKLGGDFYLADLGRAARGIQDALFSEPESRGAKLLQDFLGRTSDTDGAKWGFRYEDLRPQTLQDYYESSLGMAVQLTYNKQSDSFNIEVGKSQRQRKELGAYYTDPRLCRFMVERTVKPLFEERLEALRKAIEKRDVESARRAFERVVTLSICDPTMGSAPFLRSSFDYLSEQYLTLHRVLLEARESLPAFFDEVTKEYSFLAGKGGQMDENGVGRWEWHILRRMLYGVDIDLKAVCIACQTFALSALKYLKQGERFPSFFNLNLKLGNALISPVKVSDRPELARQHGKAIEEMIRLRRKAVTLPNTERAYEELKKLLGKIDEIKTPIVRELVEEQVWPITQSFTEELRPFCWELEFPEVFFNEDGTLKEEAGFDVVIGNPPWDAIKFNNNEFLSSIGAVGDTVERLVAQNKAVENAYNHYRDGLEIWKKWVSEGGQYEYQQGGRDRNKWRLTTEIAWKLTNANGAMSLVVTSGIIADEGGYALKRWMFPEGESGLFVSFEKDNDVFSGTQSFTVMSFRKGRPTRTVQHLEGLTKAEQLESPPYIPLPLSIALIEKMSPCALAISSVRDEVDQSMLEKLHRYPLIVDTGAAWYAQTVSCDYHMSHGRAAFRRGGGIPLLEGKSVEQYEVAAITNIKKRIDTRTQVELDGQYRIACADVAGTLDARRMLCTVLPHGYATGDTLNCFLVEGDNAELLFLVGILNSLVIEWRVRQIARSNHIKKFTLTQLPVSRPPRPQLEGIASYVAALVTTDDRFNDLRPLLNGTKTATQESKRHEIKCLIDAEVAHLFGLTKVELDRVLEAFGKVPEETKAAVRSAFHELASNGNA